MQSKEKEMKVARIIVVFLRENATAIIRLHQL
jgi:hypothetical protein